MFLTPPIAGKFGQILFTFSLGMGAIGVENRSSGGVKRPGTSLLNIVLYSYQPSKIGGIIYATNVSTFNTQQRAQ